MAKTPLPSSKVSIVLNPGSVEPAMKAAEAKTTKLYRVPIEAIKTIPGFNVRVDSPEYRAHRDAIGQSIEANGYDSTKPLAGYVAKDDDGNNVIYVTDGHTRLDAVQNINDNPDSETSIPVLPVLVHPADKSLTDLTVALHTSNSGRPLTPFELGVVVKRLLKEDGATKADIARRLSVTSRYLDDVLLLVNGPKEVRSAVLDGKLAATQAIKELRADPEKAVEKITKAVSAAKATGKKKVTAKDIGPKLVKVTHTVSVAEDSDMKDIVKAVAAHVRSSIDANEDGDDKLAAHDAKITVTIERPAPEKPAEKAAKVKAETTAKLKAAAKEAADEGTKEAKAAAKKVAAKKAAPAKKAPSDELIEAAAKAKKPAKPVAKKKAKSDLGIPGAEAMTDDDNELVTQLPPKVLKDDNVPDDEETDI
jgi:ParB family transcriptional regulator, chromosome partitioning protein